MYFRAKKPFAIPPSICQHNLRMNNRTFAEHNRRRYQARRVGMTGAIIIAILVLTYRLMPPAAKQAITGSANTVVQSQPGLWHVTRDIDGDTIDVQMGTQKERVRFLGVDTPETHDPRKPVQCYGLVAATHTKQLLEGKNVRLEPDPEDSDRDKYGRLLRYVYLPDGTLINAELIKDGYGFAYTVFPITKLNDFRALETDAHTHNRGLWADCNVDSSRQIEQTVGAK